MVGPLPPGVPAPANAAPVAIPQMNQGNMAMALVEVKNALQMLQKALPMIPMGDPLHTEVLNTVSKLSKHIADQNNDKGLQLQSLLGMARQAMQAPPPGLAKLAPQGPTTPPAMPAAASPAA